MKLSAFTLDPLKIIFTSLVVVILIYSCNSGQSKAVKNVDSRAIAKKVFQLKTPTPDQFFIYDDSLEIVLSSTKSVQLDSCCLFLGGEIIHTEKLHPLSFAVQGVFQKVGRQNLRIKIFYNDSLSQSLSLRLIVLSENEPEQLFYKVIRKIPHGKNDFIQGLFYHKGFLYEGTGRPRHSRLIKTNPETGSVIIERKLEDKFFGEGIARVENSIYQLTYQNKIGFVYDLETFEKIREFDLQTMEGWGLTYDGENLIMSDGSSRLYFYNPSSLIQNKQLDIANNRGLVNNLNELEYHDGLIWANIYGKNTLVKIDASSGIVLAKLDLSALYPRDVPRDYDHVLNGIAYDPDLKSYYVTGKLWPVMYEIKISAE